MDGLSAPLDRPLAEAWRAQGASVVAQLDDLLILWPPAGDHAVAVDVDTGATRYTAPGMCQVVDTGSADGTDPGPPAATPRTTSWCATTMPARAKDRPRSPETSPCTTR
ncbi:hypothetical protein [Cellulomonas sp. ATA003]|uniref:hypothetical protein n=1 Tax=Cellulomonas sp. ATA003 TaxID=3073064 RepID=UPI002872D146|nr:hypothetical protein [Cellulomonas sp. ATA003]WNB84790.1 hypothetical protein REH70_13630 [Cellulomonas sp. ATA003]